MKDITVMWLAAAAMGLVILSDAAARSGPVDGSLLSFLHFMVTAVAFGGAVTLAVIAVIKALAKDDP